jgi:formylglycine-generating enzyme required for sulfatase activity
MADGKDRHWAERARRVIEAETQDFNELIKLSGLDPKRHLRFADWSAVSFRNCDLRGFDMTAARLLGCDFSGSLIDGARLDQAEIDQVASADVQAEAWGSTWGTAWGKDPVLRTNLRAAADWDAYVASWQPPKRLASDDHLPVGAVFQDAPFAPELVVIPPGWFMMGSPETERERRKAEGPQHRVRIPLRLAVGRHPVTFEQMDFAVDDGALDSYRPENRVWDRLGHLNLWENDGCPAINVSWYDAQAYVAWLSRKTRQQYRLLSEAEWEYCCRATSSGRYSFGDNRNEFSRFASYSGNSIQERPTKIGRFRANRWGLYDMHGTVCEWVEDSWHKNYADKPLELSMRGGAWRIQNSPTGVTRGGCWRTIEVGYSRSASRSRRAKVERSCGTGFRIARTLTP